MEGVDLSNTERPIMEEAPKWLHEDHQGQGAGEDEPQTLMGEETKSEDVEVPTSNNGKLKAKLVERILLTYNIIMYKNNLKNICIDMTSIERVNILQKGT